MSTGSVGGAQPGGDSGVDALAEALSIIDGASERNIPLRLVGGLAVRVLCPNFPPRQREGQDLDFASVSQASKALTAYLEERGYAPDRTFNALYGRKQLFFRHTPSARALDVLVDRIEMCHALNFRSRIERMPYTLDLADLLLSKLQIFELNDKDAQDVAYLLSAYPIGESDEPGMIDARVLREILGDDWGWWRTVTINLSRIETLIESDAERFVPATAQFDPIEQLRILQQAASEAPKSFRWRMRARVGERVRWYQIPEETEHH